MPKYTVRWCEKNWFEVTVDAVDENAAEDLVFGPFEAHGDFSSNYCLPSSPYEITTAEVFVEETKGA